MRDVKVLKMLDALPHRIGRSLRPVWIFRGLLIREDIDESLREVVETVSLSDMLVQRSGVELGQDKHSADIRIQTVTQRNIDKAKLPSERHSRFGTVFG